MRPFSEEYPYVWAKAKLACKVAKPGKDERLMSCSNNVNGGPPPPLVSSACL